MKNIRLLFLTVLLALPSFAQSDLATRTLYFVRHGACTYNDPDDRTGNPLLPLGRAQAVLAGDYLTKFPIKFSSVTSSEFTRARETGDIIAAKLGLACARDETLNECTPAATGHPSKPEQARIEAQLNQAWEKYATPATGAPRHELLACHGNVIRWFVCRALGVDPRQWRQMEIANGSITVIEIRPDNAVRLLIFNDISHVPMGQQTWTGRGPAWPLPEQAGSK